MREKLRYWSHEMDIFLFCLLASIPPTTLIYICVLLLNLEYYLAPKVGR